MHRLAEIPPEQPQSGDDGGFDDDDEVIVAEAARTHGGKTKDKRLMTQDERSGLWGAGGEGRLVDPVRRRALQADADVDVMLQLALADGERPLILDDDFARREVDFHAVAAGRHLERVASGVAGR